MNPSESRYDLMRFRLPLYAPIDGLRHHHNGPPVLHDQSTITCHPCYPDGTCERFRYPLSQSMAFPECPPGRLPYFKLTRLHIGSLALRPAISSLRNLQPLITQTLLLGTTKAYGQLLRRDFNPLDQSPMTAYGQFTYIQDVPR